MYIKDRVKNGKIRLIVRAYCEEKYKPSDPKDLEVFFAVPGISHRSNTCCSGSAYRKDYIYHRIFYI